MMNLSIRKATIQDAANIAHVHVVSWQESYHGIVPQPYLDSLDVNERTESWKSRLHRTDINVFVAILDGKLCGFVSGGVAREPVQDFDGEFYAIYILRAAKGQGIGRLLMRRLAETLRDKGLTKAVLWVLADNPSRHFYERLGAQEISQKIAPVGGADLLEIAYGWQDLRTL
jgi:ribosomal protein S18 acetylase RimI-like enzyme